jgi:tRNA A37 threonylcarbamoyltransferase TsaD
VISFDLLSQSLPEDISSYLAAAFEDIVFTHIEDRLVKVLDELDTRKVDINGIVVVGGVAANQHLRR